MPCSHYTHLLEALRSLILYPNLHIAGVAVFHVFQSEITRAAMKAEANERLLTLSTPKPRNEGPFREPEWEVRINRAI